MTTVINIRRAPRGWESDDRFVYIGRGSKWGNPFQIDEESTREGVITKYREHILGGAGRHLQGHLQEVRGRVLVCYCHPQACHGDVIAELADSP